MNKWPLRWRITAWSATSTGLVLLAFCVATIVTLFVEQIQAVDAELVRDERLLRLQSANGDVALAAERLAFAYRPWLRIALIDKNGSISRQFGSSAGLLSAGTSEAATWRLRWLDWVIWRLRQEQVGPYRVVLARSLDIKPDVVDQLMAAYLISLPVVLLLVGAAAWRLGTKALRPVAELADAAGAVTAENLSKRLPVPEVEDELARLAGVLNGMLGRLERSFHQAQRFAADASHEIRTPLTIVRGEIEAALHEGGLSAGQEKRMISALEETARIEHVSGSLLMQARLESGAAVLAMEALDMGALVSEAREDVELLGAEKGLAFESEISPGVIVRGDAAHLRRLLLNLFDNAVKFNEPRGRIWCRLAKDAGTAVLTLGNSGPGIGAEQARRLFERFSHAGTGAQVGGGSGLGLSLCREIAHAHRGRIELSEDSRPGWTEFKVTLPLSV